MSCFKQVCALISGAFLFFISLMMWFKFIWAKKELEILMIICCSYLAFYLLFLFLFLLLLPASKKCIELTNKLNKKFLIIVLLTTAIFLMKVLITQINYNKIEYFYKNCPFFLNAPIEFLYEKRCIFYNTNENSRFSYQYICSYDASKDFTNEKCGGNICSEIKKENVVCTNAINPIEKNDIARNFFLTYNEYEKFYCSRTDIPEDPKYIKQEECNNVKNKLKNQNFLNLCSDFIFCFHLIILICLIKKKSQRNAVRIHERAEIFQGNERNLLGLLNFLARMINDNIRIVLNLPNININRSFSNANTVASQNSNVDEDKNNDSSRTQNIIIENKIAYDIDTNIRKLGKNNFFSENSHISDDRSVKLEDINVGQFRLNNRNSEGENIRERSENSYNYNY